MNRALAEPPTPAAVGLAHGTLFDPAVSLTPAPSHPGALQLPARGGSKRRGLAILLNSAATLHVVWFYLALVRCYLNLESYESGTASTPYQYRLLLMLPLRWAHTSAACQSIAAALTSLRPWFPLGVIAEHVVEFPIDVASVILAGLVARQMYKAASPTGLLTPLVYPITLLMIAATYAFGTMHRLRFVYDLPSLGFFAVGLYLLYFRKPRWQFALLFVVATLNRETTLFLLVLFVLTCCLDTCPTAPEVGVTPSHGKRSWSTRRLSRGDFAMTAGLLSLWVFWHMWVVHRYATNATESWSRVWLNLWILAVPASWLQLLNCFAFCGPLLLAYRRYLKDRTLRVWLWVIPLWTVCMLHYGLFVETRIFGELIPLVACCLALVAERLLLQRLSTQHRLPAPMNAQCGFAFGQTSEICF